MESPPGVNRENSLRPHSPFAKEDLKPVGSEWSLTYATCDDIICAINQPSQLNNHAQGYLDLTFIR